MTAVDDRAGAAPALSRVERRLVEAVRRGERLDLAGKDPVDEAAMRSWGPDRTISAAVLRDIVRGRLAADADPRGVQLIGARIDGPIDLENIRSDVALQLNACFLPDGINIRDSRLLGIVLGGCRIERRVVGDRCTARLISLTDAVVTVDSSRPAVRLTGADLGQLDLGGARLSNTSGTALDLENADIHGSAFLRAGFEATGIGERGAISLLGTHIGGQLELTKARVRNDTGPAIVADRMRVDKTAFMSDDFTAAGAGWAVFSAPGAEIGGHLFLDLDRIRRATPDGGSLIFFDGLTYQGIPQSAPLHKWLTVLRDHTPDYAAQPYQQLAAVHRAAGHDREVRTILMAQRRDQLNRAGPTRAERAWGRLTGAILGYGHQPWRALLFLLATLLLAVTMSVTAGHHGGLATANASTSALPGTRSAANTAGTGTTAGAERTAGPGTNAGTGTNGGAGTNGGTGRAAGADTGGADGAAGAAAAAVPCSAVDQVGVGLDLGTPLIKTGARERCRPTATAAGDFLTVAGWVLQLLAWAFATLFIAGFTNAVRKT